MPACAPLPAWHSPDHRHQRRDEAVIVSKLMLEAHDPTNCAKVLPDLAGLSVFTYGAHYCSVDNQRNATTLACGYFNSGIRVFDIRDPGQAEGNRLLQPAAVTTPSPGSQTSRTAATGSRRARSCSAQVRLDAANGKPADALPGQRLPVAQVHQRRVAVPRKQHAAGTAKLDQICD